MYANSSIFQKHDILHIRFQQMLLMGSIDV